MSDERPPSVQPVAKGFNKLLGHRTVEWSEGRVVIEMPVADMHRNSADFVHGGVLMTLIDIACGAAGTFAAQPADARRCVSINLNVSFLRAVQSGPIRIIAVKRSGGRSIFAATAELFDSDGTLCAIGQGSFRYMSDAKRENISS